MKNAPADAPKVSRRGTSRKAPETNQGAALTDRPPSEPNIGAFRRRQASVAVILDRTFGSMAKCNPELWERRAYLMLMGTVYERLAAGPEDIPTDELIALAKALAENRRVEARSRDGITDSLSPGIRGSGELPEQFGGIVRQLYGTNFCDPGEGNVEMTEERTTESTEDAEKAISDGRVPGVG
jgi:hypothetical protein